MTERSSSIKRILRIAAVLSLAVTLCCVLAVIFPKIACSGEVIGAVDQVTEDIIESSDKVETRFLDNKDGTKKLHIWVFSDDTFKRKSLYMNAENNEEVGCQVTIHYSPAFPDLYYINDWLEAFRKPLLFAILMTAITCILFALSKPRKQEQPAMGEGVDPAGRPLFQSPYGDFVYVYLDNDTNYYEGQIDWFFRPDEDYTINLSFESDSPDMTLPNPCYEIVKELLEDKEATDYRIKKLAADYFLSKPDLVPEDTTEEMIIADSELDFIEVRINGETDFGLNIINCVFADDICITLKPDGKKSIFYRNDDEHFDEF